MRYKGFYTTVAIVLVGFILIGSTALLLTSQNGDGSLPYSSFPVGIPGAMGLVSSSEVGDQIINTISLTGTGQASDKADTATVNLGVQTQATSANGAVRENAEKMTAIIDALTSLGILEEDIQTTQYSVYPVYSRVDYQEIVSYRVTNMISVKIRDLLVVGQAIDVSASAGANQIYGVEFGLSEEKIEGLREDAYLAALDNAQGKAKLIADELDLTITGVLYVSETSYQPYQPYKSYDSYLLEGSATPILEGMLSVSVTVYVAFSFEG